MIKKLRRKLCRRRILRRMLPFKGQFAYEMQIMPIVLQWRHDGQGWSKATRGRGLTIGNFHTWYDSAWLL